MFSWVKFEVFSISAWKDENCIVTLRTRRESVVDRDAQLFEHWRVCAIVADPPREGGDVFVDECQVANLVDWCDTPVVRFPGFTTTRGCWKFDETDGRLRSVAFKQLTSIPSL